jgi:hypothetical protein
MDGPDRSEEPNLNTGTPTETSRVLTQNAKMNCSITPHEKSKEI